MNRGYKRGTQYMTSIGFIWPLTLDIKFLHAMMPYSHLSTCWIRLKPGLDNGDLIWLLQTTLLISRTHSAASNNSLDQQNPVFQVRVARLDIPKMESSSADISGENATDVIYDYDQDYDYNGTFPAVDNPVAQSTFTYIVEGILLTVVSLIGKCANIHVIQRQN